MTCLITFNCHSGTLILRHGTRCKQSDEPRDVDLQRAAHTGGTQGLLVHSPFLAAGRQRTIDGYGRDRLHADLLRAALAVVGLKVYGANITGVTGEILNKLDYVVAERTASREDLDGSKISHCLEGLLVGNRNALLNTGCTVVQRSIAFLHRYIWIRSSLLRNAPVIRGLAFGNEFHDW
jgi:hypothetical protein